MRLLREAIASNRSLFGKKLTSLKAMFTAADADRSGSVSRDEFMAVLERLG